MGRFKEYMISESGSKKILKNIKIEEMLELVEKDCKPFLKEIRKKEGFLLRRDISDTGNEFLKITPRKDRRPKDMDPILHKKLDIAFFNLFGWKARSEGVFAIPTFWSGDDYYFFPIGTYKYIWSPLIYDLFTYRGMDEEDLEDWIKDKKYTDKNIIKNTDSEIMVKCKAYYAIHRWHDRKIKEFIHGSVN